MTHYICTGDCGGESDKPGVCQAEGCSREDQALAECNCDDGLHTETMNAHGGGQGSDDVVDTELMDDQ